jgi:hypothetical protein
MCFGAGMSAFYQKNKIASHTCFFGKGEVVNYRMIVERYPNLKEEVGDSIPGCKISSPLYLMEYLPGGQLPPVLWH